MPNKNNKIKIAQIAPTSEAVSSNSNKAIYSHIAHLVDGFSKEKNTVTLFGHNESTVSG